MSNHALSPIEDVIEDARNGRMYILVDDEDRENEGDLIIPGQMATPDAINFMARYGRGLICLSLTPRRVEELKLPLMARTNEERHQTAFTVSIEAREGVTTGISAADRARTISVAIDPERGAEDLVSPGHVFPLVARDGGVLVRAGHTEAAVDVSRLAGLNPSGVICEIMNEDGTMARLPDLMPFAQEHRLKIATIADLIAYRLKHDKMVDVTATSDFQSVHGGDWLLKVYRSKSDGVEHVVLVKGTIQPDSVTWVRMHAYNPLEDVLGGVGPRGGQLRSAMEMIGEHGRGVIVLLGDSIERSPTQVLQHANGELAPPTAETRLRNYGIGAQILRDLGIHKMLMLTNTQQTVAGLEGYGLDIIERRAIAPLGETA